MSDATDKLNKVYYNDMCKKIRIIEERKEKRGKSYSRLQDEVDNNEINGLLRSQFKKEYTDPFLDFTSGNDYRHYGLTLFNNFDHWLEDRDPDYLDECVRICATCNVPIKGLLLKHLAIASETRLNRGFMYVKNAKTTKIGVEQFLFDACLDVFILTNFCGKTRAEATLLVVGRLVSNEANSRYKKASTLDKKYVEWLKKSKRSIKGIQEEYPNGWTHDEQLIFLQKFPTNPPEYLKGNRRE
ncbi:hypothetical protein [Psychromonas aquatilis]|uniref:Uncharacterized protein n=1 Tax=Psychromonas aquatilis TaxID=2005072 RepID=A0ABU9GUE4_9GAMM